MNLFLHRWWHVTAGLAVLAVLFVTMVVTRGGASAGRLVASTPTADSSVPTTKVPPGKVPATSAAGIRAVSATSRPAPGTVRLVDGPFTDRLRLQHLAVVQHPAAGVAGSFAQIADVSELLNLEVQADFYAADGTLLGSRQTAVSQSDVIRLARGGAGEEHFGGDIAFVVAAPPAYGARVSSALVSIPSLVNE